MRWIEILRRALGGEQNLPPFRGGHSSPHTFSQFDANRIGTGEGAQAFGYGLYAAENPEVYENYYRRTLARPEVRVGGRPAGELIRELGSDLDTRVAAQHVEDLLRGGLTPSGRQYLARSWADELEAARNDANAPFWASTVERRLNILRDWEQRGIDFDRGINTYDLNLHLDPQRVLVQDFPLNDQSRFVQDALGGLDFMSSAGSLQAGLRRWQQDLRDEALANAGLPLDLPRNVENAPEVLRERRRVTQDVPRQLAEELRARGIQGQLYLDELSRLGTPDPTFNMIVHPGEENRIEILRRWGLLPFIGGSALEALGGE